MKTILVIGAGRSSSSMIRYFLDNAEKENWYIRVGDMNIEMAQDKVGEHSRAEAFRFDALNQKLRRAELQKVDFVVSMLPARFHVEVVKDCIDLKINVITPSYVSEEMKELDAHFHNEKHKGRICE